MTQMISGDFACMSIAPEDFTVREMLIEVRGTVNRTAQDVSALGSNHDNLAQRVAKLETASAFELGQKSGFERGVRVIYALAAVCGLGGIAAAAKVLIPALGG